MRNILLWTSFKKEDKAWGNKAGFLGLFEVEWKLLVTTFWLRVYEQLEVGF
jgi:hypothetical protein